MTYDRREKQFRPFIAVIENGYGNPRHYEITARSALEAGALWEQRKESVLRHREWVQEIREATL